MQSHPTSTSWVRRCRFHRSHTPLAVDYHRRSGPLAGRHYYSVRMTAAAVVEADCSTCTVHQVAVVGLVAVVPLARTIAENRHHYYPASVVATFAAGCPVHKYRSIVKNYMDTFYTIINIQPAVPTSVAVAAPSCWAAVTGIRRRALAPPSSGWSPHSSHAPSRCPQRLLALANSALHSYCCCRRHRRQTDLLRPQTNYRTDPRFDRS